MLQGFPPQLSGPLVLPMPSWPTPFEPHARTLPFDRRATLCESPAAMAEAPLSPLTATGR